MDKVEDTKRFLGEGVTKEEKVIEHKEVVVQAFSVLSLLLALILIVLLEIGMESLKHGVDLVDFFLVILFAIALTFLVLEIYTLKEEVRI